MKKKKQGETEKADHTAYLSELSPCSRPQTEEDITWNKDGSFGNNVGPQIQSAELRVVLVT